RIYVAFTVDETLRQRLGGCQCTGLGGNVGRCSGVVINSNATEASQALEIRFKRKRQVRLSCRNADRRASDFRICRDECLARHNHERWFSWHNHTSWHREVFLPGLSLDRRRRSSVLLLISIWSHQTINGPVGCNGSPLLGSWVTKSRNDSQRRRIPST